MTHSKESTIIETEKKINYGHVLDFHGFNHDMNEAHSLVPHAKAIALAALADTAKRKEKTLDDYRDSIEEILEFDAIISPGMLHLSMLEHYIPNNMVITRITTKKFADPLYVPTSKEDVVLKIRKKEEPLLIEGKESQGVVYTFWMEGPNISGKYVPLFGENGVEVIAFPADTKLPKIFWKGYWADFIKMQNSLRDAIDSVEKRTNITEAHDSYFCKSINPNRLNAMPCEPIRRGGKMSQLEMIAKLPRVLSLYINHLENDRVEHISVVEPTGPYFDYAQFEADHKMFDGTSEAVQARAVQLANKSMYVYTRQNAIFDIWKDCPFDVDFTLSTNLIKQRRHLHTFISQMVVPRGTIFMDKSTFFSAPVLSEAVIKELYNRELDVETMKPFK